ncbi:MAG: hypothetical protein PHY43_03655 [Verrucomicrobiales bacterium]|nr:hypothetical protein [Verrucomicrobiales bacterium]
MADCRLSSIWRSLPGVRRICVVPAILNAPDVAMACAEFRKMLNEFCRSAATKISQLRSGWNNPAK